MAIELPERVQNLAPELFAALPVDQAMAVLSPHAPVDAARLVPKGAGPGLWLYVDDIERAHSLAQADPSPAGSWWHAIVHRREGDFSNSRYWHFRARHHPLYRDLPFDPHELVSLAEAGDPAAVEQQRQEWLALLTWCVDNG